MKVLTISSERNEPFSLDKQAHGFLNPQVNGIISARLNVIYRLSPGVLIPRLMKLAGRDVAPPFYYDRWRS